MSIYMHHQRRTPLPLVLTLAAALFVTACGPRASSADLPEDIRPLVEGAERRCGGLDNADKEGCYEEVLLGHLAESGLSDALRLLEAIGSVDPEVERSGHMYVHGIGITAYQNNPNWDETFEQCTELFQSGCYHGVIQARFMEMGEVTAQDINDLCAGYKDDAADRFVLFQCLHGLGHGLTMLYGHDLPVALESCDYLTTDWDRQSCYGGGFMENIMNATNPHHMVAEATSAMAAPAEQDGIGQQGDMAEEDDMVEHGDMAEHEHMATEWKGIDAEDPLFPCSVLEDRYLLQCYIMQTSAILWLNEWDIEEAAATCLTAPQNMHWTCIQSLGRDIAGHVVGDPKKGIEECAKASADLRAWCHVGFVKNLIDVTARTDQAFAFCPLLEEENSRKACYQAIGEQLYVLRATDEERTEECEVVSGDERLACLFGAGLVTFEPVGG